MLQNDDASQCTAMVFLDFSKAFGTVSHKLLLTQLEFCGISAGAPEWFGSSLSYCCQRIKVEHASDVTVSEYLGITASVP